LAATAEIAGLPVAQIENIITRPALPEILGIALNALATGLKHRTTVH